MCTTPSYSIFSIPLKINVMHICLLTFMTFADVSFCQNISLQPNGTQHLTHNSDVMTFFSTRNKICKGDKMRYRTDATSRWVSSLNY